MEDGRGDNQSQALVRLGGDVAEWRTGRRRLGPMPAELWNEAARLASQLGVGLVARTLNLGHAALMRRTLPRAAPAAAPAFVEISAGDLMGGGATLELSCPDGARLTLRMPAGTPLDVAAVVGAFRGSAA